MYQYLPRIFSFSPFKSTKVDDTCVLLIDLNEQMYSTVFLAVNSNNMEYKRFILEIHLNLLEEIRKNRCLFSSITCVCVCINSYFP